MARQGRFVHALTATAAAFVVAASAGSACARKSGEASGSSPSTSSTASGRAPGASSSGPMPAASELDPRLAARDTRPLPANAQLRFQAISRTPDPRANHRWVLLDDGSLFLSFHSDDSEGATPYDRDLDLSAPTTEIETKARVELLNVVFGDLGGGVSFGKLDPFQQGPPGAEGGMWRVVTARLQDGTWHEVVFDRVNNPMLDALQRVASTYRTD